MTMLPKRWKHFWNLPTHDKARKLCISHALPLDYTKLTAQLLDTKGNLEERALNVVACTKDRIEFRLERTISGIFQLQLQDGNHFLSKKVILL